MALILTPIQRLSDYAEDEYARKVADHTWDEIDNSGRGFLPTADGSFMHLARQARDNGYLPLVPLRSFGSFSATGVPETKVPAISRWQFLSETPPSDADMRGWLMHERNLGWGYVHDCQLIVFDLDTLDEDRSAAMVYWLLGNIPGPPPMMRKSRLPKVQLYYRAGRGCHQETSPETFYDSGQTVLFAVHPDYQIPFHWRYGSPALRPIDDLPVCDGYHQLRFLQAWGGADGNGDGDAQYAKRSGKIAALFKLARAHRIPVQDPDDMAAIVRVAPPQSRHNIAIAAASRMRHTMHAGANLIYDIIWPAYRDALASGGDKSQRDIAKRHADFKRAIGWVERKVEEGE